MAGSGNKNDITGNLEDDDVIDTVPPIAVADLHLLEIGPNEAVNCWTAPDDSADSGIVAEYDFRLSLDSLTAANFDSALTAGTVFPDSASNEQCLTISGLEGEQTYWVALRSRDKANNWSAPSGWLFSAQLIRSENHICFPLRTCSPTAKESPI